MWMQKDFVVKNDNNKRRSWQKYIFETNVEQTKGNVRFHLYLHPLGTWLKKIS
jgi:hypothetical protein